MLKELARFLGENEVVIRGYVKKAEIPMFKYKQGNFLISLKAVATYLETPKKDTETL